MSASVDDLDKSSNVLVHKDAAIPPSTKVSGFLAASLSSTFPWIQFVFVQRTCYGIALYSQ